MRAPGPSKPFPAPQLQWPEAPASSYTDSAFSADTGVRTEPHTKTRWYGWQTLIADGSFLLIAASGSEAALPVYVLGGPLVHWAHGNVGRGVGSLALRVGAPLGLALAFTSNCSDEEEMGCLGAAIGGALVGALAAVVIDATVIARDTVIVEDKTSIAIGPARIAPAVAVTPQEGRFMLVGTF